MRSGLKLSLWIQCAAIAGLLGVSRAAIAQEAVAKASSQCLDQTKVNKIESTFKFITDPRNKTAPPINLDLCDPNGFVFKIYDALILLMDIQFAESKTDAFDQGIIGKSPFDFLQKRVTIFSIRAQCEASDMIAFADPASLMVSLCPSLKSYAKLDIASTLLHEARHLDTAKFFHSKCLRGESRKVAACDERHSDKGAYAVDTEFYVKVARSKSLPAELRDHARRQAVEYFTIGFNEPPLGIRWGVVLQSEEGELSFYDGVREHRRITKSSSTDVVFSRGSKLISVTPKNGAEEDLAYLDSLDMQCMISPGRLACRSPRGKVSLKLSTLRTLSFVQLGDRLGLLGEEGSIYYLPRTSEEIFKLTQESDLQKSPNPNGIKNLVNFKNNTAIALTLDGTVSEIVKSTNTSSKMEVFRGRKFKKIVGPVLYSEKLDEL